MTSKYTKRYIGGLIVIITLLIGFLYIKYTTFTANTITQIQLLDPVQTIVDQFDFDKSTPYLAYDMRSDSPRIDDKLSEALSFRLVNTLNNTLTYEISDITESGFILKDSEEDTYILVPHSNQISSSQALSQYYTTLMPSRLTLNQAPIANITLNSWDYLSYEDQWIPLEEDQWSSLNSNQMDLFDFQVDNVHLDFQSDKAYTTGLLRVTDSINNLIVYDGVLETDALFVPEYDGDFNYHIQLIYNDTARFKGDLITEFNVHIDRPIKVSLKKEQIEQGDHNILTIQYASDQENFNVEQLPYDVHFFKTDHTTHAVLYADYNTKSGSYPFVVKSSLSDKSWQLNLEIVPRQFHIQQLVIDETVASTTKNDIANAEFAKIYSPLRFNSSEEDYTEGAYRLPTTGRLSTEYGETRYVNGSPTSYRHSGLDIATPRGTEVYATNSGKVVLATPLILTGNTILIDHGQGIFSTYFHLDALDVKADQMVAKGDLIGKVGTTGFSTGPHLHFIISYYNHNLEPGYFLVDEPITYNNYKEILK